MHPTHWIGYRLILPLLAVSALLVLVPGVGFSFPADDKGSEYTISKKAINVFRDDQPNSTVFYYVPPELRLVTDKGLPQLRFYLNCEKEHCHGVIQMQVTAALSNEEMKSLRQQIATQYKLDEPSIEVRPVGPIDECQVGVLFLEDKDQKQVSVLDAVTAKPIDPAASAPSPVKTRYGPTWLNQPFWIQFEASDLNALIYEKLLKAETGGIIAFLYGEYDAATPEYGVDATLRVKEAINFFRNLESTSKGWQVGPFGNRRTETTEKIRQSFKSNSYITVNWRTGGEDPKKWENVEKALWDFILRECFSQKPAEAKPGADPKVSEPASMEMPSQEFSMFGMKFKSPSFLLSFGRSSAASTFDYKYDATGERQFSYTGRFIRKLSLPIMGAMNVGRLPKPQKDSMFVTISEDLPRVRITVPPVTGALEEKAFVNAEFQGSIPEGTSGTPFRISYDSTSKAFVSDKNFTRYGDAFERILPSRDISADAFKAVFRLPSVQNLSQKGPAGPQDFPELARNVAVDASVPGLFVLRMAETKPVTLFTFSLTENWPADTRLTGYGHVRGVSGAFLKPEFKVVELGPGREFQLAVPGVQLTRVIATYGSADAAKNLTLSGAAMAVANSSLENFSIATFRQADFTDGSPAH